MLIRMVRVLSLVWKRRGRRSTSASLPPTTKVWVKGDWSRSLFCHLVSSGVSGNSAGIGSLDLSTAVADVDGADCWARRRYERHLSVLMIASKAPVTLGSSFSSSKSSSKFQRITCHDRVFFTAMPLFSAPRARTSTQNNVFSQYNIIPTQLTNSLSPIAEVPLSKSA